MNTEIKELIRARGLKQWQVALALGVSERTLICWLRVELTDERKQRILDAINDLTERG